MRSVLSGASVGNQPTARLRPQASRSSLAPAALGSALVDPRSVSNDPKVARPRLKTIDCQGDGVSGRSGRPTVAHTMDLAVSLEVSQPSERLVLEAHGSRDHPVENEPGISRNAARRRSDPARSGPSQAAAPAAAQRSVGESRLGCGLTPYRRVLTEASSAAAAQHHRLTSGRTDHLKPTPSAPRATDAAATPGALHLDQVRIIHRL
jgi:hypothetical protein